MEEYVWKIFRIILTRARVCQTLPASTVKLVSCLVTFLLHTRLSADCIERVGYILLHASRVILK